MPQGPDGKSIIIVKKVTGHGGHHGGSWKVAYADFVTSMMAFFMVLWLINSASVKTREQIAYYFRKPGVFSKGSGTPLQAGGAGILPDSFAPPADANSQIQPHNQIYSVDQSGGIKREAFGKVEGRSVSDPSDPFAKLEKELSSPELRPEQLPTKQLSGTKAELEQVASELKELVTKEKGQIGGALGSVSVKMDQRGLRLEIMDTSKASMFQRGSASVESVAKDQLAKIAKLLTKLPNPIDIEGHTDAAPYSISMSRRYDNWDLSVDRANAARRVLLQMGFKDSQFARVVGYAAQRPRLPNDPMNPTNRRITISMRYTEQAAKALAGTNVVETDTVLQKRVVKENGAAGPVREEKRDGAPNASGGRGAPVNALPANGAVREAAPNNSREVSPRSSSQINDEDGFPVEDEPIQ